MFCDNNNLNKDHNYAKNEDYLSKKNCLKFTRMQSCTTQPQPYNWQLNNTPYHHFPLKVSCCQISLLQT